MAQVCQVPLLMVVNFSPGGGDDLPDSSLPQQMGEPSARSAHVWLLPLLIAVNVSPRGGDA